MMTTLSPGFPLVVEDTTENHWIGTSRDMVLAFAYRGSYDDVRHVQVGARVVERMSRDQNAPVKLMFVVQSHAKPPEPAVRSEFVKVARRRHAQVAKAAVVVLGAGFGAAIQRSAIAGVLVVLRTTVPIKVVSTVRDGLSSLVDENSIGFHELVLRCEALAEGLPLPPTKPPSAVPRSP
jgi:hypothetical protein